MQTPIPTATTIAAKISFKNGLFNGYNDLIDAFLSQLPASVKEQEKNDRSIEVLYKDVKRILFTPENHTSLTKEHWVLVA